MRKHMSGWSNYSEIVTSQNMIEREMGDRGSKSDSKISVKEQRVDDNWHKRSSFVFKVYSNGFWKKQSSQNPFLVNKRQIINSIPKRDLEFTRSFSTVSQVTKLPCWWVAGFVDAEGCFRISIIKNKNYKGNPFLPSIYSENNGWGATMPLSVRLYFQIGLHLKDEKILNLIQSTLGVGKVYKSKSRPDSVELQVSSFKDMSAIIEFFDKYPLITQKWTDFLLFKKAYELILNKQHLTIEGLIKLVEIKALINKGLPDQLKEAFPKFKLNKGRCEVIKEIPDPNWIAGFTSGEGSFNVRVFKSSSHAIGYQTQLRFQITQQARDKFLMERLVSYLDCGYISERGDIIDFKVTKYSDIVDKIIPFFEKYHIIGVKLDNFQDFCKVAKLVGDKDHLTVEGLEKIRLLKSNMNTFREID